MNAEGLKNRIYSLEDMKMYNEIVISLLLVSLILSMAFNKQFKEISQQKVSPFKRPVASIVAVIIFALWVVAAWASYEHLILGLP